MNNRKRQIEKVRKNEKIRVRKEKMRVQQQIKCFTQTILSAKHLLYQDTFIRMMYPSIVEDCEKLNEITDKILK